MKHLLFLRHGKAERYSFEKQDFDRELTSRGIRNSEQISEILLHHKIVPEIIIASPSMRTKQTAEIFAGNIGFPINDIRFEPGLYDQVGVAEMVEILESIEDDKHVIMVVGHNPWISSITSSFTSGFFQDIPTTGLVALAFDVDSWKDVEVWKGKLDFYEYPKKYE